MKHNVIFSMISMAAAGALMPSAAFAHNTWSVTIGSGYGDPDYDYGGYSQYDRHAAEHEQLDEQHADAHDQLDEEHAEAHEQGLSPWEHAQLHRQLRYQHELNDYRIAREHWRQHYRDYQQRYSNYGDYGYSGY